MATYEYGSVIVPCVRQGTVYLRSLGYPPAWDAGVSGGYMGLLQIADQPVLKIQSTSFMFLRSGATINPGGYAPMAGDDSFDTPCFATFTHGLGVVVASTAPIAYGVETSIDAGVSINVAAFPQSPSGIAPAPEQFTHAYASGVTGTGGYPIQSRGFGGFSTYYPATTDDNFLFIPPPLGTFVEAAIWPGLDTTAVYSAGWGTPILSSFNQQQNDFTNYFFQLGGGTNSQIGAAASVIAADGFVGSLDSANTFTFAIASDQAAWNAAGATIGDIAANRYPGVVYDAPYAQPLAWTFLLNGGVLIVLAADLSWYESYQLAAAADDTTAQAVLGDVSTVQQFNGNIFDCTATIDYSTAMQPTVYFTRNSTIPGVLLGRGTAGDIILPLNMPLPMTCVPCVSGLMPN